MIQKIAIGNDHAGTELKFALKLYLEDKGYDVSNFGTDTNDSVDYPDYVHPLAKSVESGEANLGILICGSAQGVAMTANKHNNIRAAVCWTPEIAALTKQHNNANMLCLPARFVSDVIAKECVDLFLKTKFEGGRHQCRVEKIVEFET